MNTKQRVQLDSAVAEGARLAADNAAVRTQLDALQQRLDTLESSLHAVGLLVAAVSTGTPATKEPPAGEAG
jgi:hypothetical protein